VPSNSTTEPPLAGTDLDAHRVARLAAEIGVATAFEVQRDLAGNVEQFDFQPARAAVEMTQPERLAERHLLAADALRRKHAEDRIGIEHRQHAIGGVEGEGLALAQMQEPGDGVDVRAGEDDALDRRGAQPTSRMKDRLRLDLLAKIGGGVDQEPALAVAAHGERSLRPGHGLGITGARTTTRLGIRVPLREATARGSAQDDGLHDDRRRLSRGREAAIRDRQRRRS
jgi:hypothetical protein